MKKTAVTVFSIFTLVISLSLSSLIPVHAISNSSISPNIVSNNIVGNSIVEYENGSHSYVYLIGGYDGFPSAYNFTNNIYYAPINNKDDTIGSWTTSTYSLPVNMAWESAIIRKINKVSYIYVFGGEGYSSGYQVYNTVYYTSINSNGSINAWQTNPNSIPGSGIILTGIQALTIKNGTQYIYIFGGDDCSGCSGITSSVLYTTISSNGTLAPFLSTSSLPVGIFQPTVVSYTNNNNVTFFYIVGGQIFHPVSPIGDISNIYYTSVNKDGTLNPWLTSSVNLPTDMCANLDIVQSNTIHSIGGWSYSAGNGIANDYSININQNGTLTKWTNDLNILPNSTEPAGIIEYTNTDPDYLFVLGGFNNSLTYSNSASNLIYKAKVNGNKLGVWKQQSQTMPVGP